MKQIRIVGRLFKGLALVGLLSACNHENKVTPIQTTGITANDPNAKISSLLRLVDDSGREIQYVKSGKFFGKLSRVGKAPWDNYYVTYTYNDNNPAGDLWISKKTYMASNNSFVKEHKFKIVNGLCVLSENGTGETFEYKYNPQGYLDEIKQFDQGLLVESWKYKYDLTYRLNTVEHKKDGKPYHSYHFTYKPVQNKYPLNIEYGIKDRYLPFFGNHSNQLIHEVFDQNFMTNKTFIKTYYSSYLTDSDGLVTSQDMVEYSAAWTETFKYSATTWQGLPGNP
jgi:hypothetical protein